MEGPQGRPFQHLIPAILTMSPSSHPISLFSPNLYLPLLSLYSWRDTFTLFLNLLPTPSLPQCHPIPLALISHSPLSLLSLALSLLLFPPPQPPSNHYPLTHPPPATLSHPLTPPIFPLLKNSVTKYNI